MFRVSRREIEGALAGVPEARVLLLRDDALAVVLTQDAAGACLVLIDKSVARVFVAGDERLFFIHYQGETYEVAVVDPLEVHGRVMDRGGTRFVLAPMPGTVVAIPVGVGDAVRVGDVVVVIESMKLEVSLRAACDAIVLEIPFAAGMTFDRDAVLMRFEGA